MRKNILFRDVSMTLLLKVFLLLHLTGRHETIAFRSCDFRHCSIQSTCLPHSPFYRKNDQHRNVPMCGLAAVTTRDRETEELNVLSYPKDSVIEQEDVPSNLFDAIEIFFFSRDYGPLLVVISILLFASKRLLLESLHPIDVISCVAASAFWSFQEHFLHQKVLHSKFDWIGKDIHRGHHNKPYYHISIDPASLLLGWLFACHFLLRSLLPLPIALSATIGYAFAGLFYEWAHYIVHTKVRFTSSFWKRVKENHIRHHVVDDNYWFAFSLPIIDDIFKTNPSVKEVQRRKQQQPP